MWLLKLPKDPGKGTFVAVKCTACEAFDSAVHFEVGASVFSIYRQYALSVMVQIFVLYSN